MHVHHSTVRAERSGISRGGAGAHAAARRRARVATRNPRLCSTANIANRTQIRTWRDGEQYAKPMPALPVAVAEHGETHATFRTTVASPVSILARRVPTEEDCRVLLRLSRRASPPRDFSGQEATSTSERMRGLGPIAWYQRRRWRRAGRNWRPSCGSSRTCSIPTPAGSGTPCPKWPARARRGRGRLFWAAPVSATPSTVCCCQSGRLN